MAILVSFGLRKFVEEDQEYAVVWTKEMGLPSVKLEIPKNVGLQNEPSIIPNNAWFSRCCNGNQNFRDLVTRVLNTENKYLHLSDEIMALVEALPEEHDNIGVQTVYRWTKVWAKAAKEKFGDAAGIEVLP